jgi:hypothetical protein
MAPGQLLAVEENDGAASSQMRNFGFLSFQSKPRQVSQDSSRYQEVPTENKEEEEDRKRDKNGTSSP